MQMGFLTVRTLYLQGEGSFVLLCMERFIWPAVVSAGVMLGPI